MNKEKIKFNSCAATIAIWAMAPAIIILFATDNLVAYLCFGAWVLILISMLKWGTKRWGI